MEQVSVDLPFEFEEEEMSELDLMDQRELDRVSESAKEKYSELQVEDREGGLSFQEELHLEVLVQQARDLIFQCNLELTEFIVVISRDSHLEGMQKKISCQPGTQNEGDDPDLSRQSSVNIQIWFNKIVQTLESFKKTFTLREVQLTMLLFIVQHRKLQNFRQLYLKNYGMLSSYIIPPELTMQPINLFILEDLFKKEAQFLKIYHEEIMSLKHYYCIQNRDEINQIIGKMKIYHSKIKSIGEIFQWACIKDKGDLFSVSPIDVRWQKLTSSGSIRYVTLADKHTLAESFEGLKNSITVVNAAMSVIDRHKTYEDEGVSEKVRHLINTALRVIKVGIFREEAKHEASIMMAEPKQQLTQEIWNLPENKKFKLFVQLSLPSIQQSEVLYLPRILKHYFTQKYEKGKNCGIDLKQFIIKDPTTYYNEIIQKSPYEESIRIRINSPFKLKRITTPIEEQSSSAYQKVWKSLLSSFKKEQKKPDCLIFHIHGGGFISMSSFIHQTYTRTWANHLQVPIVSVDYGKAPSRPFPYGLYDCLQAYMWTIQIFKQIHEVEPKRIVIVGDSAGGNLSAALVTLLIAWKLPLPTGLVLVYPALNLDFNNYTPSLLTALNDMILSHTFLKICMKAYLKDERYKAEEDPFISPLLTPNWILEKYPKTEILVGNKDPFHDDCCRFVQKLNQAKDENANLTIFQQFPHGFLQFDIKVFPNQYARAATKEVQNSLRKLLKI